ncbi:MAG: PIN domain-containing protein [Gemmatimonadetes bacterium]|nr:PIN domain-containing protein [Gemmatimonadota bacterium]
MGLILETSVLIEAERDRLHLPDLMNAWVGEVHLAAVTVAELWQGVERAVQEPVRDRREAWVASLCEATDILPYDAAVARVHARLWGRLSSRGIVVGAYDMLIAATAVAHEYTLATLNVREFSRIPELRLLDVQPFRRA